MNPKISLLGITIIVIVLGLLSRMHDTKKNTMMIISVTEIVKTVHFLVMGVVDLVIRMAKVKYIKCDICGGTIKEGFLSSSYRSLFEFMQSKSKIDICEKCIQKLDYLSTDVKAEQKVADEIVEKAFDTYQNVDLREAYLQGIDDTLKIMSHYRMNKLAMPKT